MNLSPTFSFFLVLPSSFFNMSGEVLYRFCNGREIFE